MVNVLIVDDSSLTRKIVRRALGMSALPLGEVWEAENGEQALAVLADQWVDVVLADINMPVMGGVEMIERMARDHLLDKVPVIIVSTERSEERIDRLRQLGVRGYLSKPFRPEDLFNVVASTLSLGAGHGT